MIASVAVSVRVVGIGWCSGDATLLIAVSFVIEVAVPLVGCIELLAGVPIFTFPGTRLAVGAFKDS